MTNGRCFELDDGTPNGYDWSEMIAIATELRGAAIRRVNVPQPVLASIGFANVWLGRALHRAPMLTSGKVRELFHRDWVCRTHGHPRGVVMATRSRLRRRAAPVVAGIAR